MIKITRTLLFLAVFALPLFAQDAPEAWVVDKGHSTATFKIRHFTANVVGQFRDFEGSINIDRANPAKSSVEFTIQAKSIDTGGERRDNHLRSADFFDVEKFPTITFKSTSVAPKSKDTFDVTGDLTMHGVTKRVTLPVTFLGFMKHPRGEKAGFEIETVVNRKDYGVTWNRALDEGGFMLSDDVKVSINLEVDRKVPAPAAAPAPTK
ncbi:MAG TPA: YceI family protein [Thermoanaerobaculia bacterium]|nr:YceI family protein [Thermoanaerobaculia bacterium]